VFGIWKTENGAIAHVSNQQHATRTEDHLARVRRIGKNCNVETCRHFQP